MRKKQNSVFDKFQEFWGGLNKDEQKALWDVMSAIRGPDVGVGDMEGIKFLSTSRIRPLLLGRNSAKYGFSFSSLREAKDRGRKYDIGIPTPGKSKKALRKASSWHFKLHLVSALVALKSRYPTKVSSIAKSVGMDLSL